VNLYEGFARIVAAQPGVPALLAAGGAEISFGELDRRAGLLAERCRRAGLGAGGTVLVLQPISIDLYVLLLALCRIGAVAMFLDPTAGSAHIERCCARRAPDAFAAGWRGQLLRLRHRPLRTIRRTISFGRWPFADLRVDGATTSHEPEASTMAIERVSDGHPFLVTFTSGTTGEPKAAVRTHGLLRAQHERLVEELGLRPSQVDLATLPIFVLANLASGTTSVLPNADLRSIRTIDPAPIVDQLRAHAPVRVVASPSFLERLAATGRSIGCFRLVYTGGAPVFLADLDRFASFFPEARIVNLYGSTEAEPIASIARDELDERDRDRMRNGGGLCVGRPVPQVDVRVIADSFGTPIGATTAVRFDAARLQIGVVGEIVVAGEHVLPGYLDGVGDEATKFRVDGRPWHRTGDAGFFDTQGRLWLVGRCAARIERDRRRWYPLPLEAALRERLGVRVAVLDHRGRIVVAAAEVAETAVRAALAEPVLAQQLGIELPPIDDVVVLERLPFDARHAAKIELAALRALLDRS
jgi:acyl-CoA synthetase (AMP-forming)/AMP-acid ligase II